MAQYTVPTRLSCAGTAMANTQLEIGFTQMPNKLLMGLMSTRLSNWERRIVDAIARKTFGFHKEMDRISHTQLADLTGIPRTKCSEVIGKLVEKNIIIKTGPKNRPNYSIQRDYTQWKVSPRGGTGVGVPQEGDKVSPREGTKVSPRWGHTKDKKETYKKINGKSSQKGREHKANQHQQAEIRSPERNDGHDEVPMRFITELLKDLDARHSGEITEEEFNKRQALREAIVSEAVE